MWCVWHSCKNELKDGQLWVHIVNKHILLRVDPLEPLANHQELKWIIVAAFLSKEFGWTFKTHVAGNQALSRVCTSRDQSAQLKKKHSSWKVINDHRVEKAGLVTHDVETFRTRDEDVFLERLVALACLAYRRRADNLKALWKDSQTMQLQVAQRSISVGRYDANRHRVSVNIEQLSRSPNSIVLYKVLIGDQEYLIRNSNVTQATPTESLTLPWAECAPVPEPPQKRQRV